MSAAAASEAAFGGGGGVEKGPLQQPNPDAMMYMHNGVTYNNAPVPGAYQQRPAGGNAASPAAARAPSPGAVGSGEPFKRKSGRPRKYAPDGPMPLAVVPAAAAAGGGSSAPDGVGAAPTLPPGFSPTMEGGGGASRPAPPPAAAPDASAAKKMGRPPGSGAKKLQPQRAPQAQGGGLTGLKPHIFTVQAGEDVASRAMTFSCNGWAVCILSANGAISNVTLRQGDSSGGTVTYEGRFEILSLAGSYLLSDSSGLSSRTGGLSVSLAGPDGRVLGGSVAGPLTAASPVQVVIGSFLSDGKKEPDLGFAPGRLAYSTFALSSSPSSGGNLNESSGAGSFNTSNQPGFPNYASWK